MSVLTGKELRIVGFLCNWCSYGGADTAGVARFTQPTDLRIIRVPCSGRVNPLFPLKALLSGADGVLVSGCHPRDCHYSEGNYYARRRLETLKEFLPIIGIDPRRFEYTWVSASEGQRWQIVVKGCDSRGVVELLQENLINREDVVVFGMGCNGTIDINRVLAKIGDVTEVESVTGSGATLKVRADGKDYEFAMQDVAQDKCRACTVPNAVIHDHFAGSPTNIPDGAQPAMPAIMTFLDGLSLEDRMGFWRGHIDRCIRCYACRNACPMCVCRDNCVADSREPHWLTQEDSPTQKMFFQLIHAMHLAGRCTGCGECNRACPMGIPVGALKLQMGRVVKKLFEYAPGMDVDAVPPLLGFQLEEKNIHDHHIEGA